MSAPVAAVLLAAAVGQARGGGPGEARPAPLALPGFRAHLLVHEDLDPDLLRPLARDGAVLWMRTRSNALRSSGVENLARFSEAYVQLRPPIGARHVDILSGAPFAGAWLDEESLRGEGTHRLGHRRLAVRLRGPLTEERAARLRRARPSRIDWEPGADVDLLSWGLFRQLSGRKLVRLPRLGLAGEGQCPGPAGWAAFWVDLKALSGDRWPVPCGHPARVRVPLEVPDDALRWMVQSDPRVELELEIGEDSAAARSARALLDRLEAASPVAKGRPRRAGGLPPKGDELRD